MKLISLISTSGKSKAEIVKKTINAFDKYQKIKSLETK